MPATLASLLACAGLTASTTDAATMQSGDAVNQPYSYMTSGSIDGPGGGPILFIGTASQTLTTPGTFALGQFETLNVLPTSGMLTYNNTPFTIDMNVPSGTGSGNYTYEISGNLNGSITGSGLSTMVATVSSITGVPTTLDGTTTTPPFPASDISVNVPQGIIAPNATNGTDGFTTLYATVSPGIGLPVPAPEPASIAVVAAGLMAWGIRRRMARARLKTDAAA